MSSASVHSLTVAGLAGLTAFAVTVLLTPLVRAFAIRSGRVARSATDRWGRRVIARLGGVSMFLGFLVAILIWVPRGQVLIGLLTGASLVFALGFLDDLRRLPPYTKLVAQLLIGCLLVMSGIRIELIAWPWVSIPLSILWFVLIMNAFNLLDNMDGLAAGIGALAAGFCAFHAAAAQDWTVVSLAAILLGVCFGFLWFNFPPAKIYMGDSGSHFLGLSLAMLALLRTWHESSRLVSVLAVPVLVLAVPIFDTCFVTIQRLLHRRHPFVGGTDHVSHRLAILGLSTRRTILTLYVVSACLGMVSVLSIALRPLAAGVLWLFVLSGLLLVGAYLARVEVYRVESQPAPGGPLLRTGSITFIETMLLHKRRLVEILADFCLISSAYVVAHLLRFDGVLTGDIQRLVVQSLPVVLVVKLSCFAVFGLYRGVWRYLGLSDVRTVFKAVTMGSILSSLSLLYLWRFAGYSRSVLIIDWMLSFLAVGGARVVERILDEWINKASVERTPVLIIGAGDTGAHVLRSLTGEGQEQRHVVGFLDDDVRKHGNRITGAPVFGGRSRLAELLDLHGVREVLIAINDPPGDLLQHVQKCCEPRSAVWKVVTAGVTDVA